MLLRTTFLLIITCVVITESSKLHEIIKSVGKRFDDKLFQYIPQTKYGDGRWHKNCHRDPACQFVIAGDNQVRKFKLKSALKVLSLLYQTASKENKYFDYAIGWIESIMDPDMTAEICGDTNKTLNMYQYIKYLRQTAAMFGPTPRINWAFQIGATAKNVLRFQTDIVQWDKRFNLMAKTHYDVTMKLNLDHKDKGTWYAITHVETGGICPQNGALVYENNDEIDVLIDDLEDLKQHPTARTLLGFFTPLQYQFTDPEQKRIPAFWIQGLEDGLSKIYVCQNDLKESVEYTTEEFRRWYGRFGIMWHPEAGFEEDFTSMRVETIEEEKIIAMVTMKLQMGLETKVLDWNFKVSALKVPSGGNSSHWFIRDLEVPCNLNFNRKEESFKTIRDVIATTFVEDLVDLPDPSQWYSTVAFVKRFTKAGFKGFKYCDHDTKLDKFIFDRNVLRISKFTKYWINHSDVPTQYEPQPSPDSGFVSFKTISQSQIKDQKTEWENEWKFEVKWDEMDQFYYVEHLEIGCHKKILNGEYGDGVGYTDIDYGEVEEK